VTDSIERWDFFELALSGPAGGNPFTDITFSARFRYQNREIAVDCFYDGGGIYRVRFMPDTLGEWQYTTHSSVSALDGIQGAFVCVEPTAGKHGPVRVRNTYHFAYADGTLYWPIGTTCYAWTHQGEVLEEQTLATLRRSPFNKLRMCIFPKHYTFNANEPNHYPFERTGPELTDWDFGRFDPAFFRHIERRVGDLRALGVEADLILFHAYDRWGFSRMSRDSNERYLRYVVARLAAYRNVWWSLANEYDLMLKTIPVGDWDRLFQIIQTHDPYQHLRSIHNWQQLETHDCRTFYDHSKPWVTHCSIQHAHVDLASEWRNQYQKPIVLDEVCYEGNIPNGWGNITAEEITRRFWEGTVRGGYVGHGETYLDPQDVLWWSKGGILKGDSPARIAFLRQVLEDGPVGGLNPVGEITNTHVASAGQPGEYYLTYFGNRQPAEITFSLPTGQPYRADMIDTWGMAITTLDRVVEDQTRIELPGKPYIAVRLRRVR
jgi:hypothetical protein